MRWRARRRMVSRSVLKGSVMASFWSRRADRSRLEKGADLVGRGFRVGTSHVDQPLGVGAVEEEIREQVGFAERAAGHDAGKRPPHQRALGAVALEAFRGERAQVL